MLDMRLITGELRVERISPRGHKILMILLLDPNDLKRALSTRGKKRIIYYNLCGSSWGREGLDVWERKGGREGGPIYLMVFSHTFSLRRKATRQYR